jgi:hypothetical protein
MATSKNDAVEKITSTETSPDTSKSGYADRNTYPDAKGLSLPAAAVERITRTSNTLSVFVAGVALFSDGYNAQIIGYMEPLLSVL